MFLQDLLSIANIAEQHEVWDFLSMSSRSYSFGRSSSVVRTLAVNVGDAVDDTVRQFKGVSGGLKKKAAGPGLPSESSASVANRNVANSSSYKEGRPAAQSNERNGISSEVRSELLSVAANYPSTSGLKEDPLGVPAEVILVISIM
ncbi:hypothetical protein HanOQP8_Chr16g0604131 [Helianthus annuus]|nr:hypothetical protein HanOQP8_Chr16g0604131 [Helianthus annuus]